MSVSLLEVIEAGGYDLTTKEDAIWLLSKRNEFAELVEKAQDLIEKIEQAESQRIEDEYNKKFPR